jgi:hypothetical protein
MKTTTYDMQLTCPDVSILRRWTEHRDTSELLECFAILLSEQLVDSLT